MNILFLASISVITRDPAKGRKLFVDGLGLSLTRHEGDEYHYSEKIPGSKHFGVWPLSQAAEACFGVKTWPQDQPVPQASIEFEVQDQTAVTSAAKELEAAGYPLLHGPRTEPWGQTVARLQTDEGLIVGISYAPWLHKS